MRARATMHDSRDGVGATKAWTSDRRVLHSLCTLAVGDRGILGEGRSKTSRRHEGTIRKSDSVYRRFLERLPLT